MYLQRCLQRFLVLVWESCIVFQVKVEVARESINGWVGVARDPVEIVANTSLDHRKEMQIMVVVVVLLVWLLGPKQV